jgi:hypothetical protein
MSDVYGDPVDPDRNWFGIDLTNAQKRAVVLLEKDAGAVKYIDVDNPIIKEFDLGDGAVMLVFESVRVLLRADGGIAPIPNLKRI